jgi:AAA domain
MSELRNPVREVISWGAKFTPPVFGAVNGALFDLSAFIVRNLVVRQGPLPWDSRGQKWELDACPFNPAHTGGCAVVTLSHDGVIGFKCHHNGCADKHWRDVRERFEGPRSERKSAAPVVPAVDPTPLITDLSQLPSVWSLESSLDWCVEEMIARGSITLICSESGTGKTWLGYYIAGRVACGLPVLGRGVWRSKVLYLDGENPLYTVKQRLSDLGIQETGDLIVWGGWNLSPPQGPQSRLLIDFARQHRPLIIFDSLIEFHPGSEQSSTETRAFMKYFRALANLGATIVVLHHSGKAETAKIYRGSSDIKAAVDTAYQLESIDKESNRLGRLSLKCFKGRLMPGQNFELEFRAKEGFVACEVATRTQTVEEIIAEILQANPGSNQTKIVRLGRIRGCSKRQVEQCLGTGPWQKATGPNNSTLYSVPPDGPDQEDEN